MTTLPAAPTDGHPALGARRHRVRAIVGPPPGAPAGLYLHGAEPGPLVATPVGRRHSIVVPAGAVADLGAYANAFPAAQWRARAGTEVVTLQVRVDAAAVLTVHTSDEHGRVRDGGQHLLAAGEPTGIDVPVADVAGLVWCSLRAGDRPVTVEDAGWAVREEPRPGGLVVGGPTVGRAADVVANLLRIAEAPALLEVVQRIVVVDHAPEPIEGTVRGGAGVLGDRLRVVRQANLGGAGGYSRVMHEALATPGADAVLLLDDDIVVDPAALLAAFEFGRRTRGCDLVGLQMLDAARPGVLEAAAEHIVGASFWWAPADPRLPGTDVAAAPLAALPGLHAPAPADFAGWWGALVPLEVVRAIGYALPLFLKWDDAEFALRAADAGFSTVSLQGAAVWHESWRTKDDAVGWPAHLHARNRVIAALLHGPPGSRTGVVVANLALEVKQLLALRRFAVEVRQEGVRAVLVGPEALARPFDPRPLQARAAAAVEQQPVSGAAGLRGSRVVLAPRAAPSGAALAAWTAVLVLRHLVVPVRGGAPVRLAPARAGWWVVPSTDDVVVPTADRRAHVRLTRDRRRFRQLLVASVGLHLRLWLAWPVLRRRYRAAAGPLASPAAWSARFAAAEPAPGSANDG